MCAICFSLQTYDLYLDLPDMSAMFALEGSFSKAMLRDLLVVKVPVLPDIATRINFVAHQVCTPPKFTLESENGGFQ